MIEPNLYLLIISKIGLLEAYFKYYTSPEALTTIDPIKLNEAYDNANISLGQLRILFSMLHKGLNTKETFTLLNLTSNIYYILGDKNHSLSSDELNLVLVKLDNIRVLTTMLVRSEKMVK